MSTELITRLQERFPEVTARETLDWPSLNVPANSIVELCAFLKQKLQFDQLMDVTGVDWNEGSPRFTVIYHLYSSRNRGYVRLAATCPSDKEPEMPTISGLWPTADWHERETFDMFGIRFSGHPDLRRILMWEEYPYFPLRKEFPLTGIETELPDAADVQEVTNTKILGAPMMGGPFVSPQKGSMSNREPRAKDEQWTKDNPKPKPKPKPKPN
ncbi:MAG: NADH-quinone oxidoreductase subunit C [Opitutales bacterium]